MKSFNIKDITIGENKKIFLIAEVGVNHNGDFDLAKKLIDVAVDAKVDAVKFQTFITEKVLLRTTPKVEYQKVSNEDNESFFDMVKKYELSKEDFIILNEYCIKNEIIFLSTPFDHTSVEWLDELNVPAYKIGSGELTNYPLLKLICSKQKPILLSTGMANLDEVKESVNFIKSNKIEEIVIFQCTTDYPSRFEDLNLNVIDTYKKEFLNDIIGFSDHSLGIEASIGAVAKGAKVIEKHFTLDKNLEGPDHRASLDPDELVQWVKGIRNIEKALGSYDKFPSKIEIEIAKIARKSIVTVRDLKAGHIITEDDISVKRPGYGIFPIYFEKVIGKKLKKDIPKESILSWDDFE